MASKKSRRAVPPCVASMGCLCAGHARGNPATAPCDTSETPRRPRQPQKSKSLCLYVDQFGASFYAHSVKELRQKIDGGGSRVSRMYTDTKDGRVLHVGYVIGNHWLRKFVPDERPVNRGGDACSSPT